MTDLDWHVLTEDLPPILRRLRRARLCVDRELVESWSDLEQLVYLDLLKRDARGSGYDPDRGPLVAYLVQCVDGVCSQILRKQRRAAKREADPNLPAWAVGRAKSGVHASLQLSDTERAWLDAYAATGSKDKASAASGLRQRDGRALAHRIHGALLDADTETAPSGGSRTAPALDPHTHGAKRRRSWL